MCYACAKVKVRHHGINKFDPPPYATGAQVMMAAALSPRNVKGWDNGVYDVPLGHDLLVTPLALASQSTHWGSDGGWARIRGQTHCCWIRRICCWIIPVVGTSPGVTSSSVQVSIDEDINCDSERKHTSEQVSVCAFSGPFVL
eukprot:Skav225726  [mRNA]  locus=scaffold611:56057:56485:+ [translate_table: standard]